MLTVIKVTDWIAIALFLAGSGACIYLGFQGYKMCFVIGAALAVFPVLLAIHRVRKDLGGDK